MQSCASARGKSPFARDCLNPARAESPGFKAEQMSADLMQGLNEMVASRIPQMDADIKALVRSVTAIHTVVDRIEQHYFVSLNRMAGTSSVDGMSMKEVGDGMKALLAALEKQNSLAAFPSQSSRPEALLRKVDQVFTDLHVTQQQLTINVNDDTDVPDEGRNAKDVRSVKMRPGAHATALQRAHLKEELQQFHNVLLGDLRSQNIKEELQQFHDLLRKQPLECHLPTLDDKLRDYGDAVVRQISDKLQVSDKMTPGYMGNTGSYNLAPLATSTVDNHTRPLMPYVSLPIQHEPKPVLTMEQEKQLAEEEAVEEEIEEEEKQIEMLEDNSFASIFVIDGDMEKLPYRVENFYSTRGFAQGIARSSRFLDMTTGVVFLNAIWIGIEAQYSKKDNIYDEEAWLIIFTQIFVVYFTAELVIRFLAFEIKGNCLRDGWFRFDSFLVATMVLDTWGIMLVMKFMESDHPLQVPTQPFRVLRLLKLTRMARLANLFPELITLVKGLFRSFRAICSTVILVMICDYVWALLLHMLLKDEDAFNSKIYQQSYLDFSTVGRCMWTLIMNGTLLLDNASPLMTQLLFNEKANIVVAGILFLFFMFLTAILILQMLIGVLCDLVSTLQDEQTESFAIGKVKSRLLARLRSLDEDGDGQVEKLEFMKLLQEKSAKATLRDMGINQMFLLQMMEMLYSTTKSVSITSALSVILLCREDQKTTIKTLAGGVGYLVRELKSLKEETLYYLNPSHHNPQAMGLPFGVTPPLISPRDPRGPGEPQELQNLRHLSKMQQDHLLLQHTSPPSNIKR